MTSTTMRTNWSSGALAMSNLRVGSRATVTSLELSASGCRLTTDDSANWASPIDAPAWTQPCPVTPAPVMFTIQRSSRDSSGGDVGESPCCDSADGGNGPPHETAGVGVVEVTGHRASGRAARVPHPASRSGRPQSATGKIAYQSATSVLPRRRAMTAPCDVAVARSPTDKDDVGRLDQSVADVRSNLPLTDPTEPNHWTGASEQGRVGVGGSNVEVAR
jgi:hypothetical protein